MLPLTYCRKTVVKGGMVSHVGYHDTISVKYCVIVLKLAELRDKKEADQRKQGNM